MNLDSIRDDLVSAERAARALREVAAFMEWGLTTAGPTIVIYFTVDGDGNRDFEVAFHGAGIEPASEAA